nr:zinc knuckle CX2CX4HX4C [Tanacetum cinerariifolium]
MTDEELKNHKLVILVWNGRAMSLQRIHYNNTITKTSFPAITCYRSSYARAMIKLQVDVELKDTLVVAMPKLVGDGFYMWTIRVEYEWEPPRCLTCNVLGHVLDDCPKRINFRCLEEFEES